MPYQNRNSRYNGAEVIVDEGILRDRTTIYLGYPLTVTYQDLPENTRYIVRMGDRIDHLATAFYGNPRLWWVIAEFQEEPLMEPFGLEPGTELTIPPYEFVMTQILTKGRT